MSFKIYLVEDEHHLNQVLTMYLRQEGWDVTSFTNGKEALNVIANEPHLWILDIMLPEVDGYEILKKIKDHNQSTPVIFISARDADLDRILGLELGSEDYLSKPFLPKELIIRAKKILNRTYEKFQTNIEKYGPYEINKQKRLVFLDGNPLSLTSLEFDLFALFADHIGRAFSREEILNLVWGEDYFGSDRVVDDLVRRIRRKMPFINIETVYGFGYRAVDVHEK
ncbi:response regulator transcription factor [Bacillus carboniphilus]|uniref:Response regulator transcription factor n=1 Tax=Bacillus carboniphilus TaxID=86663 RepID=A0ABY9JRC2_9BACI|nr:response regulator transcription factor [Bacillus carboniphilus]WLR41273.1 response regulator transcription factor [Bacillus carboniphilus]